MRCLHIISGFEIRDRASDLEDAMRRAREKPQTIDRGPQ